MVKKPKPSRISKWVLLIIPILLLNFFLGARMILAGDFFFLADQARDMLLTRDIVLHRDLVLIGTHSGIGGFFHGPLWLYMLVPVFLIGGGNPYIFALFYIFLALLTVLLAFFVEYKLYNVYFGLLLAFITAVSPTTWSYVTNTIGVNMESLIFFLLFFFLVRYLRGDNNSFIYASFFAGLSLQFEVALPLMLIPLLVGIFFLGPSAIKLYKTIGLSIFAYILSVSTFIIFDLRHHFLMTNAFIHMLSSHEIGKGYLFWPQRIQEHAMSLVSTYKTIFISSDRLLEFNGILILLLFIYRAFIKKQVPAKVIKEFFFFLLFPIVVFILYLVYSYPIYPEYVFGLTVPIAFGFVLACIYIWEVQYGKIFVSLFLIITFLDAGQILKQQYFEPYTRNQTDGSYRNQKEVVEWIFKDARNKPFSYFVYTPNVFTYGMDYLFWWEGTKRYGFVPSGEKKNPTYLILYPFPSGDEGAHIFWEKNIVRTNSKSLVRKEFNGNIVVEKHNLLGEPEADPNYYQNLIFR